MSVVVIIVLFPETARRTEWHQGIDVASNKIICRGLSMPHSPRMADGKL